MDFFDHQDVARRNSSRLTWLFVLAVFAIVGSLYGLFAGLWVWGQLKSGATWEQVRYFHPGLLLWVGGGTIAIVGIGSLMKILELRGGGRAVAESLGGRLLSPEAQGAAERRLLNVVEEMAIASGTPVPPVYLLENETAINAFAAGYSPEDAVVGVTRGCMEKLTRDQLQGVIAHEFSHILNGDMRLNIRLMGMLHGILVIGLIGQGILRMAAYSGSAHRRRDKDNGGAQLALIGLAIFIIGYVGFFFGKLIKAAVSRQREFLADASAVQFTRNPDGIAGALKAIGGYSRHGALYAPQAESCSHMFFSKSSPGVSMLNSLATHPPLDERIRRIDPQFDGFCPEVDEDYSAISAESATAAMGFAGGGGGAKPPPLPMPKPAAVSAEQVTNAIGAIDPDRLSYVRELIAAMPPSLRDAAHDPYSARALVYALLLDDADAIRAKQLDHLTRQAEPGMHAATQALLPPLASAGREIYLPLADLAMPALRQLSPDQYERFRANIHALVIADDRVDLFEYALEHMLVRHLDRTFRQTPPTPTRYYSLKPFGEQIGIILSVLARAGADNESEAARAFQAGVAHLGSEVDTSVGSLRSSQVANLAAVDQVLPTLDQLGAKQKRKLIGAATVCIAADGVIAIEEAELLRAISDSLSCPIPPLLATA